MSWEDDPATILNSIRFRIEEFMPFHGGSSVTETLIKHGNVVLLCKYAEHN